MNITRLGLATALAALSTLAACSTWQGMTDSMSGRSTSSDTAAGRSGTTATGSMPGADTSTMRGTAPASAGRGMPAFRDYNECRAWLAQQGGALNRGPTAGGEASMIDTDPCLGLPRS